MDEKKKDKKAQEQVPELDEREGLVKEIDELKAQVEEYKDKWMRNVAEFDNYKKRTAKNWQEAFNEGIASVIVKILPVG
ncbi:MAG: nucleotide exchange factor GrpE, partial [Clostridia bacterium]|nr:nucleotide exchange factor GrpE [Clostridia bacterium]